MKNPGRAPVLFLHGGAGNWDGRRAAGAEAGCREAGMEAWRGLDAGGPALESVCHAVRLLENDPRFNAGRGSVPNRDGDVCMDASVMVSGNCEAGAVAEIRHFPNPVLLARAVMEHSPHVLLFGAGAECFADEHGFDRCDPDDLRGEDEAPDHETVGAVALDMNGRLAAATSTGGRRGSLPGRVGDSPIPGAGVWADRHVAISCTGIGEAILRVALARHVSVLVARGVTVREAAEEAMRELERETGSEAGLIAVTASGAIARVHNAAGMATCVVLDGETHTACLADS